MKKKDPPKTKEVVLEDSSLTSACRLILENTLKFDFSKNK